MSDVRPQDFATPLAVLLGAGLIAWVLHRDLSALAESTARSASSAAVTLPAPALPPLPALPGIPGGPPGMPFPTNGPEAASGDVMERDAANRRLEDTQALLRSQSTEYIKACWGPPVGAKTPKPPPLRMNVDFDATGREIARRARLVIPVQDPASAEGKLADCVASGKPPRLKSAPAGKPESMQLHLVF